MSAVFVGPGLALFTPAQGKRLCSYRLLQAQFPLQDLSASSCTSLQPWASPLCDIGCRCLGSAVPRAPEGQHAPEEAAVGQLQAWPRAPALTWALTGQRLPLLRHSESLWQDNGHQNWF